MFNHIKKLSAISMAVALLVPAMSSAQGTWSSADWDTDGTAGLTSDEFNAQFATTGTYDAWDRDDVVGLNEGEFATGMYANWDADNDMQITEDEYTAGANRWYGPDYATPFNDYDVDSSGYIDRTEFGNAWDNEYYSTWDTDADGTLTEDEFSTGTYNTADVNSDMVVTIEEEGWFEGWFDGDDIEAEIQEVGDVM
ncbi:EF-hand domain-containing protein [Pseudosulfitobacter koreensis]|uniref:EF-hand domain-containing protein n=1 Tax=Pseudosulfitobacter koreensis TaxID=2968472 RepID=A0ABT1Z453_9RHOB|nr:hypothetical protein [Pseudosulfitobacter koreense]MCR8827917.1 hypothetical protein [Pseudosulfitobacter koreense]